MLEWAVWIAIGLVAFGSGLVMLSALSKVLRRVVIRRFTDSLPDRMEQYAAGCVRGARLFEHRLDYSPGSLALVDDEIETHFHGSTNEEVRQYIPGFAAYLGTTLIRNFGGRWEMDPAAGPVVMDAGGQPGVRVRVFDAVKAKFNLRAGLKLGELVGQVEAPPGVWPGENPDYGSPDLFIQHLADADSQTLLGAVRIEAERAASALGLDMGGPVQTIHDTLRSQISRQRWVDRMSKGALLQLSCLWAELVRRIYPGSSYRVLEVPGVGKLLVLDRGGKDDRAPFVEVHAYWWLPGRALEL